MKSYQNSNLAIHMQGSLKSENYSENIKSDDESYDITENINDYESYDPIPNERKIIVRTLLDIVLRGGDLKIEIMKGDLVNDSLTKLINKGISFTNFLETFQLAMEKSLINGKSFLRISGDITAPKLYIARSVVATWDLADNRKIKSIRAMFPINDGVETNSIIRESYSILEGELHSVLNGGIKKTFKIESMTKLPYIILIPNKDTNTGRATSIFEMAKEREEFFTATFNKKMVYAKNVNYHLLPDKAVIQDNFETTTWMNKLKNLLIFRKDKLSKDPNAGEAIEKIEPNMDYFIKTIDANDEAGKHLSDSIGIQNPTFQGTKQMSEHEIKVLKQKEEITIRKLKKYAEHSLEYILGFYIQGEFTVNLNVYKQLTKNEIENKKVEMELQEKEEKDESRINN